MTANEQATATLHLGDCCWHSGPGWKAWVIDQVTRLLAGDGYDKLVSDACETDHEWKTGTAP